MKVLDLVEFTRIVALSSEELETIVGVSGSNKPDVVTGPIPLFARTTSSAFLQFGDAKLTAPLHFSRPPPANSRLTVSEIDRKASVASGSHIRRPPIMHRVHDLPFGQYHSPWDRPH